ncbi:MAG TPA: PLP-dependent aminotransferase family protein [Solirubrobacteraceae bacterium]|nr:PLP-dependent aminotransferase family protein [Solirubrobacteraceae bacterium]
MGSDRGPVSGPELLIELDRAGTLPLHEQIERSLREQIRAGRLSAGARVPSTRMLAAELGVSRGVVTEAYGQLSAEGYLTARQGAPVRVAGGVHGVERPPAVSLVESFAYDFRPGVPDLAAFPTEAWVRAVRAGLRESQLDALGYGDPRGTPSLREALADYLRRVRGCDADPEHVLVSAGFMQALSLLCRALRLRGVESVAVEDPGWHVHRLIVEEAGLEVVPIPVDDAGIDVAELARSDAPAVVVTPANQFPTSAVLSPQRRAALVEWAGDERLVVEDDYDSEYRYDRVAVGALQGLAPERIVHIGSASKRLAPGLRLGWMLLPSWLTWELTASKTIEDGGCEVVGQLALASFLARGELDRHVRRMRLRYAARRRALLRALGRWLPEVAHTAPGEAGLFLLARLPPGADEAGLARAAAARGVGVDGLSLHRFRAVGEPGLVLGYGGLAEPSIERGVQLLAAALGEVGAGT